MAITDLTNTIWTLNRIPEYTYDGSCNLSQKFINFLSNGNSYTSISVTFEQAYDVEVSYGNTRVFCEDNPGWISSNYEIINITGGADVTNSALISFLETYGTDITEIYLTNNSEISSIADAIRVKGGTSSSLTYPNGFITAIQNLPTGANLQLGKVVTPTVNAQIVGADSGYDGLYNVTVMGMPIQISQNPLTNVVYIS